MEGVVITSNLRPSAVVPGNSQISDHKSMLDEPESEEEASPLPRIREYQVTIEVMSIYQGKKLTWMEGFKFLQDLGLDGVKGDRLTALQLNNLVFRFPGNTQATESCICYKLDSCK